MYSRVLVAPVPNNFAMSKCGLLTRQYAEVVINRSVARSPIICCALGISMSGVAIRASSTLVVLWSIMVLSSASHPGGRDVVSLVFLVSVLAFLATQAGFKPILNLKLVKSVKLPKMFFFTNLHVHIINTFTMEAGIKLWIRFNFQLCRLLIHNKTMFLAEK